MVIKWTKLALSDLKEFRLISKKSNTNEYILELFKYSQQLKQSPQLGHVYKSIKNNIIRRLIYQEHSILYYIDAETIYILAVIHHKQSINIKLKNISSILKNK